MAENIVAMAVFVKDGKVLLEKRKEKEDNYAGLWAFPGGHKEKGESIEEALKREMKEELGIDIILPNFIGKFNDIDPTSKEEYVHHAFLCTQWKGEIKGTFEEEKVEWIDIKKIKDMESVSGPTKKISEKIEDTDKY